MSGVSYPRYDTAAAEAWIVTALLNRLPRFISALPRL
jgi:hypothetical protein